MTIRPYRDADRDDVLEAWERASRIAHAFLPEEFFPEERQRMIDLYLPTAETTVHERDGRVVGFVSMAGSEVGGLFVHPDHHRVGVGRALLDAVTARHPVVELDVFEANPFGRAFYAAYGFEEVGRRINPELGHPELRLRFQRRADT